MLVIKIGSLFIIVARYSFLYFDTLVAERTGKVKTSAYLDPICVIRRQVEITYLVIVAIHH